MQRHPARRRHAPAAAAPTQRAPGWARTPSTPPRRSSNLLAAYRPARGRRRRSRLPRGPQRGRHLGRRRRQRHPRPLHGRTSTTASPPTAAARMPCAHLRGLFAGFEIEVVDLAEGARPGLDAPLAQAFLAAVGGQAQAEIRLDGCRPLLRARHPGRQLRPGRPVARARRRRAGADRSDRSLRARPAGMADVESA